MSMTKQIKSSADQKSLGNFSAHRNGDPDRHMFSSRVMWSRPYPTIAVMMRPANRWGNLTQHRHLSMSRLDFPSVGRKWDGAIREDIMQWLLQK